VSANSHTVRIPARFATGEAAVAADRYWVRLATFSALAAYATARWATLMRPAPGWRLLGLLGLAIVLAAGVPKLRRFGTPVCVAVAVAVVLIAFPIAGLRWHWFVHLQLAVSAARIGNGLQALPNVLVPYLGSDHGVRLVIVLGAAVLLFDGAAVIAFAPRSFGDGRRAAAALPLIALAVVPSTLVRPEFPYLQGLVLFGLVAAFVWGERIRAEAVSAALAVAALVGVGAALVAPRLDQHTPWIDYRAWTGTLVHQHVDAFDWNQSYGPLHWPRAGHEVLTVAAQRPDYWKAEDLDRFNGHAWVAGVAAIGPAPPQPSASARARWTQSIRVTIAGMRTSDVIAAGSAAQPSVIPGGLGDGIDPGTWVANRRLGPGTNYEVSTYSPRPSARELRRAGRRYPDQELSNDLTLGIPVAGVPASRLPEVTFPAFHSSAQPFVASGDFVPDTTRLVRSSPYGRAYALARRLAARAATPYAFVIAVERYLSRGFTYNENPPPSRYPLAAFLFKTRLGYCQQFSGAMAMLLRMGGLPARVAAGFTPGTLNASTHQWVVTDIDAHAWVEVWFPRYGWVRFDPTPTSAPARGGNVSLPALKSSGAPERRAPIAPRRDAGSGPASTSSTHSHAGSGTSAWLWVGALVLLAGLLAAARKLLWQGRSTEQLLSEFERALSRTRRPLPPGTTLASMERRLATAPGAAGYVRALRLARYGDAIAPPSAQQRRALRQELARGLGLTGRVRALWALPPWVRRPGQRQSRS
jgi:transglutaminase-like putative cysteine protease